MSRRWRRALARLAVGLAALGWTLDRHAPVRAGNDLFAAGSYAEAEAKYNQALVDQPDSSLLHFNRGDAAYKLGRFDDALGSFERAEGGDAGAGGRARAAYNAGNTKYRLGAAAAAEDPKKALDLWADALVAYRRAIVADSEDPDAKFNYEVVQRKIDELRERLQKEQQEQEQQQQQEQEQGGEEEENQEQQAEQPESEQDEQQQEQPEQQQEQDQQQAEQPQQEEQKQPEPAPDEPQQQEQAGGAGAQPQAAERTEEDLSEREAGALLDALRDEEVKPEEMVRQLQGGVVAEPARDW